MDLPGEIVRDGDERVRVYALLEGMGEPPLFDLDTFTDHGESMIDKVVEFKYRGRRMRGPVIDAHGPTDLIVLVNHERYGVHEFTVVH